MDAVDRCSMRIPLVAHLSYHLTAPINSGQEKEVDPPHRRSQSRISVKKSKSVCEGKVNRYLSIQTISRRDRQADTKDLTSSSKLSRSVKRSTDRSSVSFSWISFPFTSSLDFLMNPKSSYERILMAPRCRLFSFGGAI